MFNKRNGTLYTGVTSNLIKRIYEHKNKIDGKCYIGVTKQKPEIRWRNGKGY